MSEKNQETVEAAENLLGAANALSFHPVTFAQHIRRGHPSVQQSVACVVFELIHQWAEDYSLGNFDGRNEAVVKACDQIVKSVNKGRMI